MKWGLLTAEREAAGHNKKKQEPEDRLVTGGGRCHAVLNLDTGGFDKKKKNEGGGGY